MRPDLLADLAAFRLVASESSFTRAARRLGVTQSALSQQIRRLEEKLGVRLLARTTRSVAPTEAGTRLLGKLAPALDDIETEIELLASLRDQPIGPIRISAGKHAAATILWPKLVPLMHGNPGILVEICVDDSYVDIVAGRFDAGVRMGERLEKDMVALPIGPPLRIAVVASPDYIRRHGAPREPAELSDHRCICFRTPLGELSPWSFDKGDHHFTVTPGRGPVFNDSDLMVSAAKEGLGILYIVEDLVQEPLKDGSLARILAGWCDQFPGYYIYYPSRRLQTAAFALLLESLRHPSAAK